jgi:hypothetical protein
MVKKGKDEGKKGLNFHFAHYLIGKYILGAFGRCS